MFLGSLNYIRQFDKRLWILSLGWFSSALGFAVSIPFIAIYFHASLGLSVFQIGLFFATLAIVRSLFQVIGGEASDRIERRFLLTYSQVIRAAAFLFTALAVYLDGGFWAIAVGLLINSIFGAVFQPAANAMVSDILPQEKRLDGYAVTRSAGNLGWAVGPAIGGFLAGYSYGFLFIISAAFTLVSGMVFQIFLRTPQRVQPAERFKFADVIAIKDDHNLAWHCGLIFILYLVVAQLIAPFSIYSVEMVKISEHQLGLLYTLNGMMVVLLQIPLTRMLAGHKLTIQLALGAAVYAVGYGAVGFGGGFYHFIGAVVIITFGEIMMSPPSLALTSRLAPEGKMGRYMGVFGFFVTSGWSFGPLYGGFILDHFGHRHELAWALIALLALISSGGYLFLTRQLPEPVNRK